IMASLRKKTGVKAIAYGYRHTFATDALASGVPDAQVAALLGHSGTSMLHKHYAHLLSKTKFCVRLWAKSDSVRKAKGTDGRAAFGLFPPASPSVPLWRGLVRCLWPG